MQFESMDEGIVFRGGEGDEAVAAGPRCAVLDNGETLCSFMAQSALGINDFVPMIARSPDGGRAWQPATSMFPLLRGRQSIFGSISRTPGGELLFFGTRTPIDTPGESFWSEQTQGLKQNELIWSRSADGGATWSEPALIPMPIAGAAEAPGAMCATRSGVRLGCYSPYHTFDPAVAVDRHQVLCMRSEDCGRTWTGSSMLRFPDTDSLAAEAWVVELADGRLLGTCWHTNSRAKTDYPNAYAVSLDSGRTWQPTRDTGTMGQTTALAPLDDGRVLFLYVQRRHGEPSIHLAVAKPTPEQFNLEHDQAVWHAPAATQRGGDAAHTNWQDFSFGEPHVAALPDRTLLLVYWAIAPDWRGVGYQRLHWAGDG